MSQGMRMIRVCQCKSGKAARNYYTKADYYLDRQELAGRWGGSVIAMLGLDDGGEVSKRPFDFLCENRHPLTGDKLTVRLKAERTSGYDINFHCPKSVSLLYAMTEDADILDAFRRAVDQTMQAMEARMRTRVRTDGQCFDRLVGNMGWATFVHLTARPILGLPDPHLHAHCFCFNAVFDPVEERFKAGQFREIKQQAPRFQALFRSLFAARLTRAGYDVAWKGEDFEIAGFSPALLRKFSRRTALIESEAERLGILSDKLKDTLGAKTREKKQSDATMSDLRPLWYQRMTDDERQQLARAELFKRRPWPGDRRRQRRGDTHDHGDEAQELWLHERRQAAHERYRADHERRQRAASRQPASRRSVARRTSIPPPAAMPTPKANQPKRRSDGHGR
jgi:conjugative relaxase-like TrwC/TraI family protein